MLKKIMIQVIIMTLSLFIPFFMLFIPMASMKGKKSLTQVESKQSTILIYSIFLMILLLLFRLNIGADLLSKIHVFSMMPVYFLNSFTSVLVLFLLYITLFLGSEYLIIALAKVQKLKVLDQCVIVTLVMSTLSLAALFFIAPHTSEIVKKIFSSSQLMLQQLEPSQKNAYLEQLALIKTYHIEIVVMLVFVTVIFTYATVFRPYVRFFKLSYGFILIYCICMVLLWQKAPFQHVISAYKNVIMLSYTLYGIKELYLWLIEKTRVRFLTTLLLVILFLTLPLEIGFAVGVLFSFNIFKSKKTL